MIFSPWFLLLVGAVGASATMAYSRAQARYQGEVSVFVPLPPRRKPTEA